LGAEVEQDRLVVGLTWVLCALATAAAELALGEPGEPAAVALGRGAVLVVVALGVQRALRHRDRAWSWALVGLLGLFVLPFGVEGVRLVVAGHARPLELVLLALLRNLGLGLAVLSLRAVFGRMAALVSLFLVLVGCSMAEGVVAAGILAAYAVGGCVWLMGVYWRGLHLAGSGAGRRRYPLAMVAGLLGLVAVVMVVGPTRAAMTLGALFPSSGGSWGDNPDARSGVNDGDQEVSASRNPQSIGFTDSDIYLDTDRPSLYDAFNDVYGEPVKPKRRERMVAMSNPDIREQEERPAENLRAGRSFAALRRPSREPSRRPGERTAQALAYLKGRTPLHLGLAAYDRFDGTHWHEQPHCRWTCPLELQDVARPWFRIVLPVAPVFGATVSHQVKVGTLDTGSLPAPGHLARFRVGAVNQADFFGWSHEGMIRMRDRTIPAGTVVETEARTVDPRRLRRVVFPREEVSAGRVTLRHGGYALDGRVEAMARRWGEGLPRGWEQVEAVVGALRRHAQHDRGVVVPADCDDVVAHFLLGSRRGPDYQFATAAAVLLDALGYRTRLVSGLYAAPERYDARTQHTPLRSDDVHVWTEVCLPSGTWVGIEPTPGYAMAGPALSVWESLLAVLDDVLRWAGRHGVWLGLVAVLGVVLAWHRREVLDCLAMLWWRLGVGGSSRECVVRTLRLVEWRARWAGWPRPPGKTPRRWYGPLAVAVPERGGDLEALLRLAEWGLYAPADQEAPGVGVGAGCDAMSTCMSVARGWTLRRLRQAGASLAGNAKEILT
jgi:hypothetical protein